MNVYRLLFLMLGALLLVACGGEGADGPPEIRYGEDTCDQCQMIINEPRFAAAFVTDAGDFYRFDDTGEMFLYATTNAEAVRTFWVHDFDGESWLEADGATFVHNPQLQTPMGWGIAAFAEHEAAAAYQAQAGGVLLTSAELQAQVADGELHPAGMSALPGDHHDHNHNDHTQ